MLCQRPLTSRWSTFGYSSTSPSLLLRWLLSTFRNLNSTNSLTKVLLQTYIEYLRGLVEDKKTINHHGREREIDLDMMNEKPIQVKPAVTQAFDLEWVLSSSSPIVHLSTNLAWESLISDYWTLNIAFMHKVSQASLFNILPVIIYPFVNVLLWLFFQDFKR